MRRSGGIWQGHDVSLLVTSNHYFGAFPTPVAAFLAFFLAAAPLTVFSVRVGALFFALLPFFLDPPGFSISQARLPASHSRARSSVSSSTASPRLNVAFVSPSVT